MSVALTERVRHFAGFSQQQFQAKGLLFQLSLVAGLGLGTVLLIQTIGTYSYVSRSLVRRSAVSEGEQRLHELETHYAAAQAAPSSASWLDAIGSVKKRNPSSVAWIRVVNPQGEVEAGSGFAPVHLITPSTPVLRNGRPPKLDRLSQLRGRDVVAIARPLRIPPVSSGAAVNSNGTFPRPYFAEVGIFSDQVAASFGLLRVSLVIGCSAAIALMIAIVVIGLRASNYLKGRQLAHELSLARNVQLDLLPPAGWMRSSLDIAAECTPAREVGGDFYDVIGSERHRTALVLGDVSGKGLPAALLASLILGALRALCWTNRSGAIEQLAGQLNRLLCARSAAERFASLIWCHYDARSSVLSYVNAGHLPPLLISRNAKKGFEIRRLEAGGPVLGLLPDADYRHGEVKIHPGDLLVMFSDGITEAMNRDAEEYGEERLLLSICSRYHDAPEMICSGVLQEMNRFLGTQHAHDDQTLVVVRLRPDDSIERTADELEWSELPGFWREPLAATAGRGLVMASGESQAPAGTAAQWLC